MQYLLRIREVNQRSERKDPSDVSRHTAQLWEVDDAQCCGSMISISHSKYCTDPGGEGMYKSSLTLTDIMPKRYQVEAQGNTWPIKCLGESGQGPIIPYWVSIFACRTRHLAQTAVSNKTTPPFRGRMCFVQSPAGLLLCRSHKGLSRKQELVLRRFFHLIISGNQEFIIRS